MGDVDTDTLRVLTVKQPWADAIAYGPKRVENRTWLPKYRGPLAIHAGLIPDQHWSHGIEGGHPMLEWMRDPDPFDPARRGRPVLAGSVLAVCDLIDAHAQSSPRCRCDGWGSHLGGTTHLVLADVRPLLEPVRFKGGLGLRYPDADLLAALDTQGLLLRGVQDSR